MSIRVSVPILQDIGLYQVLANILRKAVDGTATPLFVDETNQRVLVGATVASTSNIGKLEVTGGDVRVKDSGKGVVVTTPDGTKQYRIGVDNFGALTATLLALALCLTPSMSYASRAIMEGMAASDNTLFVSTSNHRVVIGTITYGGAAGNVALYVSSNSVWSDTNAGDKIVIYATGSIVAQSMFVGGVRLTTTTTVNFAVLTGTQTFSGVNTFTSNSSWTDTGAGGNVVIYATGAVNAVSLFFGGIQVTTTTLPTVNIATMSLTNGNKTTTSTTFVAVTNSTLTLTGVTAGNRVRYSCNIQTANSGGNTSGSIMALIDGAPNSPDGSGNEDTMIHQYATTGFDTTPFSVLTSTLSAGTHNFTLMFKSGSALGTYSIAAADGAPMACDVQEVK